jgi:hypothetical protein
MVPIKAKYHENKMSSESNEEDIKTRESKKYSDCKKNF